MYASKEFGGGKTAIAEGVSCVSVMIQYMGSIPSERENHAAARRHDAKCGKNKTHEGEPLLHAYSQSLAFITNKDMLLEIRT